MIKLVNNAMPRRTRCKICMSEMEYEYNDIQRIKNDDYVLKGTIITSFIECPLCQSTVKLGEYLKEWD